MSLDYVERAVLQTSAWNNNKKSYVRMKAVENEVPSLTEQLQYLKHIVENQAIPGKFWGEYVSFFGKIICFKRPRKLWGR